MVSEGLKAGIRWETLAKTIHEILGNEPGNGSEMELHDFFSIENPWNHHEPPTN